MGLGQFLGGLVLVPVLPQIFSHHFNHLNLINCETDHICVFQSQSLPDWGVGVSSLVCLCHGSVCCASMPVCQHARSVPACQRVIPEVSELPWMVPRGPRCPEGQDMVPLCQMAQNPHLWLYLWHGNFTWFVHINKRW